MPISTPAPEHDRPLAGRRGGQQDAQDVDHAAHDRHPARAVLVGQDAGEGLAHAPRDLLHRDGEREVGDGDAEVVRCRRLEQAEILPDAHAERHHQRRAAQHGVSLAA
jgi:hypothetical protein